MKARKMIALLRGINVGGKNKIKMAELRDCLAEAGLEDVSTYIQSGNICFIGAATNTELESLIHDAIENRYGYDVPVMVRPQKWFLKLVENSPYYSNNKPKFDIKQLHATLLGKKPSAKNVKSLSDLDIEDEFEIAGDVVYLRILTGYSKTKLTNGFLEKKLGVAATTRNWKTICQLVEM